MNIKVQLSEERIGLLALYHDLAKKRAVCQADYDISLALLPAATEQSIKDMGESMQRNAATVADLDKELGILRHKLGDLQQLEVALTMQGIMAQIQQEQSAIGIGDNHSEALADLDQQLEYIGNIEHYDVTTEDGMVEFEIETNPENESLCV